MHVIVGYTDIHTGTVYESTSTAGLHLDYTLVCSDNVLLRAQEWAFAGLALTQDTQIAFTFTFTALLLETPGS